MQQQHDEDQRKNDRLTEDRLDMTKLQDPGNDLYDLYYVFRLKLPSAAQGILWRLACLAAHLPWLPAG